MEVDAKLLALSDVVIDNYINKGEPVGSKFLNSLEDVEYAPSTLRKYLNMLEKTGMVYQPYNSSGRIPTTQGLLAYLENYIAHEEEQRMAEVVNVRKGLKYIVETLGSMVDGVVVGLVRNDEYYYLGINNLLRDDLADQYQVTRSIVRFIEEKKIVQYIDKKIIKKNQMYYTFIEDFDTTISCLYAKVNIDGYDCVLSIVGPTRVNYKKNVDIMRNLINSLDR